MTLDETTRGETGRGVIGDLLAIARRAGFVAALDAIRRGDPAVVDAVAHLLAHDPLKVPGVRPAGRDGSALYWLPVAAADTPTTGSHT